MELKGFDKTKLLQPGENVNITFTLTPRLLTSYDSERNAFVAEAGTYKIHIGASSRDIRKTATFTLEKELIVETTTNAMVPEISINELSKN